MQTVESCCNGNEHASPHQDCQLLHKTHQANYLTIIIFFSCMCELNKAVNRILEVVVVVVVEEAIDLY
jgi:hypothetical protein